MRKIILACLAVAAVLIVAAGILLTNRIRTVSADLALRVERQTGVAVTSSGLPGLSFWPRFSVSLGNVVIPAPKGSTSAPLATIETMRIVPADGLFGWGENGIAEIVIEKPSINLVIGADGRANWNYATAPASAGDTEGLPLRIANGRVAFLDERTGSAVALSDVEAQTSLTGPADELNAKGAFVWNERRASFTLFLKSPQRVAEDGSPADVTLQAPGLDFQFSGRAALIKGFELDGQAGVKGTDLGMAASWFGASLPEGMNGARFELAGAVDSSAQGLLFTNAQFTLDDMRGQGDIGLALGKGRPKLDADVTVQTIDLTRYSGSTAVNKTFLANPWSTSRIDLSALRSLDAILKVGTNAFAYGAFRTGPAELTANLADGILDLKIAKAAYADGTLDLALKIDGKAATPSLQFSANGENIAADRALLAAVGFGDLRGRLSPSLSLQASGPTLADLVSTLKGQASFRAVSGTLTGIDLPAAFGKVSTAILEGWGRDERQSTGFDALSATFAISDGIAETTNLILTSPALTFTGKGEIDLLRQALDLKVDPQLAVSAATSQTAPAPLATFPVAIQVKGPWAAPRIYPDMPGILEDPASGYAALKKLGLGAPD
jgi:AsmA protein